MKFDNTLTGLAQRRTFHERQLRLIKRAEACLETGIGLTFEAHIQSDWPGVSPIMAEANDPMVACENARALWKDLNSATGKSPGNVELFVRVEDIRIAIDPVDTGFGFGLDQRIAASPRQMVFRVNEQLPGHYASSPTPAPQVFCAG